jgi:hypothetical protein
MIHLSKKMTSVDQSIHVISNPFAHLFTQLSDAGAKEIRHSGPLHFRGD